MIYDTEKRIFLASQYARSENFTLVQCEFRTKYFTKTVPVALSYSVLSQLSEKQALSDQDIIRNEKKQFKPMS